MHEKAYKHRVGDIIETMIAEAMCLANDIIMITGRNGDKFKLSETINDMEAYEKLTDSIFEKILQSKKPGLEKSKDILRKVQKRKLYKFVGEMNPKRSTKTDSELKEYIEEEKEAYYQRLLEKDISWKKDDFIINCVSLDYGMEDENPLNHVCFYTNNDVPIRCSKDEVHTLLPESPRKELRFFCKREDETRFKQAEAALDNLRLQ